MKKSESIKNIAAALSAAQAEMPVVKFNNVNPFLKNKFADLGAVIETSRPIMAKHGLAISQFPTSDGNNISVTTIITHASGEWMEDTISLPLGDEKGKSLAQVAGSIITYLRRYSWSAVMGMYADEDTDGHAQQKQESKSAAMTLDEARAVTTEKGTPLGSLTTDQLKEVAAKTQDAKRGQAARVIIAQNIKEGK